MDTDKMRNIEYKNDHQFISEIATEINRRHLAWSGSDECEPSSIICEMSGYVINWYLSSFMTVEEFEEMAEEDKARLLVKAESYARMAANVADERWKAAKAILGI